MNRFSWPMLASIVLFSAPAESRAGYDLVVNGGFETGDFTGWTATSSLAVASGYGLGGGFGVKYGPSDVDAQLYQSIATIPGATYTFSFWQQTRVSGPNEFQANWNNMVVLELMDTPITANFTQYIFTEVATSSSTQIRFALRQSPGFSAMDQVSVEPAPIVPEPSSLLMVGTALALGGSGAVARRRPARNPRRAISRSESLNGPGPLPPAPPE
jgi:hypothetical protein